MQIAPLEGWSFYTYLLFCWPSAWFLQQLSLDLDQVSAETTAQGRR